MNTEQDMIDFASYNTEPTNRAFATSTSTTTTTSSPNTNNNRASVSPNFYEDTNTSDTSSYADSKYVRSPQPTVLFEEQEEHSALLLLESPSGNADPNDPLAGHANFHDEFEDEMDEIEMMQESQRHNTTQKFITQ